MEVYVVDFGDDYERDLVGVAADLDGARRLASARLAESHFARDSYERGASYFLVSVGRLGEVMDSFDAVVLFDVEVPA